MKPVDQVIFDNGIGDCLRACLASIFEFKAIKMPNFWEDTQDATTFWNKTNKWLRANYFHTAISIQIPKEQMNMMKDILCIAIGETNRSTEEHAVVWNNGLLHDPHPSRSGFIYEPNTFVLLIPLYDVYFPRPEE